MQHTKFWVEKLILCIWGFKFENHIIKLCLKVSKNVTALYRISCFMSTQNTKWPFIHYVTLLWKFYYKESQKNKCGWSFTFCKAYVTPTFLKLYSFGLCIRFFPLDFIHTTSLKWFWLKWFRYTPVDIQSTLKLHKTFKRRLDVTWPFYVHSN